jgi:hypothetical protein
MLRLNRAQRRVLVDKLPDAANVAAGAMFFGQFLNDRPFSLLLGLAGVGLWVVVIGWTITLARKDLE